MTDVTGDQAPDITEEVICGDMHQLADDGLVYLAGYYYDELPNSVYADHPSDAIRRAGILLDRLGGWR